ncbi:hypothetical protein [Glycomyces artemisiae]|uniref:Uncharacterized protein n=1 Tax=Glycomyces artemisiae TaxID=1076443 RepID=A0A2T0USG3_9ACTN|nr:hypothetical protein [Glycomyces artemisiae]PRY60879.1 hypothetical protein B0I28_102491 [Glycomyces artemisiae]
MSAFDDYLAQVRRLDEARRSADEAAAATATVAETLGQRTQRIAEQAAATRTSVDELARTARTAPPQRTAAPAPLGDPHAELAAAETDLHTAATELEEARFLAHRPPWLPRWRADERNGLIYGAFALVCVLVQLVVLRTVRADDLTGAVVLGAILVAAPLAAFCAGWLTIGVAARPRIGDEEAKLERNFRLGLVLCGSTLLVACFGFFS